MLIESLYLINKLEMLVTTSVFYLLAEVYSARRTSPSPHSRRPSPLGAYR